MRYEDITAWTKVHNLILNRVAMINQTHGIDYGWGAPGICTVCYSRGWYTCAYSGIDLCTWHVYDLHSTDAAFRKVDHLDEALWPVTRTSQRAASRLSTFRNAESVEGRSYTCHVHRSMPE